MVQLLTTSESILLITLTAGLYLSGRTVAKYFGASLGGHIVNESPTIQKYLGGCLLCQAGVALGLSFIIEETFVALGGDAATMGILILGVVALSTMVLEVVGPLSVKRSLTAAGECIRDGPIFAPSEIKLFKLPENAPRSPLPVEDPEQNNDEKIEAKNPLD